MDLFLAFCNFRLFLDFNLGVGEYILGSGGWPWVYFRWKWVVSIYWMVKVWLIYFE